jgi:uncharacterized membrane protein YccC
VVAVFGLLEWAEPKDLLLLATLGLLQFAIEAVVARHYGLALTFITPAALTISAAGGTDLRLVQVGERVMDTVLGAAIAIAVLWTDECVRARNGGSPRAP